MKENFMAKKRRGMFSDKNCLIDFAEKMPMQRFFAVKTFSAKKNLAAKLPTEKI
jgi:hypothetical protein